MSWFVYVLCMVTSTVCAGLLLRAYKRTHSRLLLWTAVSFCFLALNNLLVFTDAVVVGPNIDLWSFRYVAALAAVCAMIYGFIWEAE